MQKYTLITQKNTLITQKNNLIMQKNTLMTQVMKNYRKCSRFFFWLAHHFSTTFSRKSWISSTRESPIKSPHVPSRHWRRPQQSFGLPHNRGSLQRRPPWTPCWVAMTTRRRKTVNIFIFIFFCFSPLMISSK